MQPKTERAAVPSENDERKTEIESSVLVGYVRKSNNGGAIKLSINVDEFNRCDFYTTSDGQKFVPLIIPISSLQKIINGERAVTSVSHFPN